MIETKDNSLGDAISSMAEYCENEHDFKDLVNCVINEVNDHAIAFYIFGSRSRFENQPNSDLDLLIFYSQRSLMLPVYQHIGVEKTLNKENTSRPWIEVIRIIPQLLPIALMDSTFYNILSSAKPLWTDPTFNPEIVKKALAFGRDKY